MKTKKNNWKIPELLAPVGSMDHLKIAINAGASSIYLSGKKYGARKFAPNFTLEEINEAVNTAHLYNVKVYVTVNTLIKENEIEDVLKYLTSLYKIGVDAVLVQDLGLVELINKYLPNLKIHASTQMTVENQQKLDYIENKGIKRVVLPREMRKEEIKKLKTNAELEIFVHGALCNSYSGQCLMSSFKGGRSGNRGDCAQPCRQKYEINGKKEYWLSPKDLCLYNNLNEIAELGIDCIKVEGRLRNKEYLAIVISSYRQALNKLKNRKESRTDELNLVFNRGFTKGQFKHNTSKSFQSGHLGLKIGEVLKVEKNQIAIKLKDYLKTIPEKGDGLLILNKNNKYGLEISQNPSLTTLNHFNKGRNKIIKDINRENRVLIIKKVKQNKRISFDLENSTVYLSKRNKITKKTKEIENSGKSYVKSQLFMNFSLENNYPKLKGKLKLPNKKEIKSEVKGSIPFEKPLKRAVSRKTIEKQLSKLDKYPFILKNIAINYNGDLFIPIKELNNLRRNLFESLENKLINSYKHEVDSFELKPVKDKKINKNCSISYYTNKLEDLEKIKNVERVYLEIPPEYNKKDSRINISYIVKFIEKALEISKDKNYKLIWKWPDIAHDNLLNSLNKAKGILKKLNYEIEIMSPNYNCEYGPYSLNITNSATVNSLKNYKIVTLSPELSKEDLANIMENCQENSKVEILVQGSVELMKSRNNIFKQNKNLKLIDSKNNKYPIYNNLSNEEIIIFNSHDLSLLEEISYLKSINLVNFSIDGRWRDDNYLKMIEIYYNAINDEINKEELLKISSKNTKGNF